MSDADNRPQVDISTYPLCHDCGIVHWVKVNDGPEERRGWHPTTECEYRQEQVALQYLDAVLRERKKNAKLRDFGRTYAQHRPLCKWYVPFFGKCECGLNEQWAILGSDNQDAE